MPSKSILLTSAYLFVVALFLSSGEHNVFGQASNDVRDCQAYTGANTTSATCDEVPGQICTGRCTGFVTATNCTRSQAFNVLEDPITVEKCTVGFGKTSATAYICQNEKFNFTCYGSFSGKAQCKGCGPISGTSTTIVSPPTNGTATSSGSSDTNTPAPAPKDTPTSTSGTASTDTSSTSSATTTGASVLALLAASLTTLLW